MLLDLVHVGLIYLLLILNQNLRWCIIHVSVLRRNTLIKLITTRIKILLYRCKLVLRPVGLLVLALVTVELGSEGCHLSIVLLVLRLLVEILVLHYVLHALVFIAETSKT